MKKMKFAVLAMAMVAFVACNKQTNASTISKTESTETTEVQSSAPEINMTTADGQTVKLSDMKGKLVYIDIWATWCPPCNAEIPHLKALYKHYKDNENVEIISISVDEDVDAWKQKIVAKEMTWKQFICIGDDTMALSENYNLRSIPRFLIINKDGKLVDDNAPRPSSSNIVEVIDNYLK